MLVSIAEAISKCIPWLAEIMGLYGLIVFLGAFLLFAIQPMIAKLILPWFGGTAAVWTMCLVFFQSTLLLGYVYADYTSRRLSPRRQAAIHTILLLLSAALLPLTLNTLRPTDPGPNPSLRILTLLSISIGLPYFLLSATSPMVQNWYSRSGPATQPYRLYALSNLASLLALLSYPFLIEPHTSTQSQLTAWALLFGVFTVVCIAGAWKARGAFIAPTGLAAAPGTQQRLLWFALAACGSMLLLAITNHLSQNVAPVPLLWVLPLAVYLLTFVIAFHHRNWYRRGLVLRLLAVALGSLGYAYYDSEFIGMVQVSLPLFCFGLFAGCLFCHCELSARRPAPRYLTSFYLMISLGGAAGALFVGVLAPHIFVTLTELPLTLSVTAALAVAVTWNDNWSMRLLWTAVTVAMLVVLVANVRSYQNGSVAMVRNFYGPLRVTQANVEPEPYRILFHGTVRHGAQYLRLPRRLEPITYYREHSGIAQAMRICCSGPKRVGVIGLGTGTLAAYGNSGDDFQFYEINPDVVRLAYALFSYLRESKATTSVVLGDARLSMQKQAPQEFDVLAIDAFSGDAIPVHLLTREAMTLYLRHLKPSGIIVFHVSNQYLDLAPVVERLASTSGLSARMVEDPATADPLSSKSDWALLTRRELTIGTAIAPKPGLAVWTDDRNNLFQVLRPIPVK